MSAVAVVLTACGGGGTTGFSGFACVPGGIRIGNAEYLVYPAPGSAGIPDNAQTIVVSRATTKLTLIPATGTPVITTTAAAVPSPLPSPNAPQHGAGAAFAVPPLAPATTYQVWSQDGSPVPGCPDTGPVLLGSFTTQ